MTDPNLQRRKVVVLCASVVIFAGAGHAVLTKHPRFLPFWLGVIAAVTCYAIYEFINLKREERQ